MDVDAGLEEDCICFVKVELELEKADDDKKI